MSSSRQRPLHACGVSIFAIGGIVIGKTQHINGPLGSTLRNMTKFIKFVTPLIYAIQYQWLIILAFIDDRILAAENIVEKVFPPSSYVFDIIDEIVLLILYFPDKFDGALNKYVPTIIHKVPLLEWILNIVISKLNCLASTLGDENSSVDEKTIGVDRNYYNSDNDEEMESNASEMYLNLPMDSSSFPPIPEAENKGVVLTVSCNHNMKGSYKEVLLESSDQKKIENDECEGKEIKMDDNNEDECESVVTCDQLEKSNSMKHDPLLELFESAWLMKPGRY